MSFDLGQLTGIGIAYLLFLSGCAWVTEKGWIPERIVAHPMIYVLSLGVCAGAWAFFGTIGLAHQFGFVFLVYYLGICGAYLLAPVLLSPILRITQTYQLGSLADIFAFRFRSTLAGTLTTIFMLLAALPLLALQIQAVADATHIMTMEFTPERLAFGFCLIIMLFTMAFGTRHIATREKHHGLVFAIAMESAVKLLVTLIIGGSILFEVFDGPQGLQQWLDINAEGLTSLHAPLQDGPWRTLLLMFFASAMVMPHMFHMAFNENLDPRNLNTASWGLPLFLLVMSISTPLILWGGLRLETSVVPEYFILGIGLAMESPLLSIIAYAGGVSAASGLTIVTTLALSAMIMNHLVLPTYQPHTDINIYRWLKWTRRLLIATIILASYGFYRLLDAQQDLTNLAIAAFVATLQFLPGVLATLYWPRANRKGFICGLVAGMAAWFVTMLVPLTGNFDVIDLYWLQISLTSDTWHWATLISLTVNVIGFVLVSMISSISREEENAAEACSAHNLDRPSRRTVSATSPREFQEKLSQPLGTYTAQREVTQALKDLEMSINERRPYALRRLRDCLEANLSGLMGPSVAQEILNRWLPYEEQADAYITEDINFIENRLEDYHHRLTGLAAELDSLRRYHRRTLQNLPMAVCSIGRDGEILMWNRAMEHTTGISGVSTVGSRLDSIDEPWRSLLGTFVDDSSRHHHKQKLTISGRPRWFNLHKAAITESRTETDQGLAILLEDLTDTQMLEEKLIHSERLASIGRLAAGVAHEIGNPLTGVDCLAQELRTLSNDQDTREIAEQILDQTKRISRILHSLVNFAHRGQTSESLTIEPVSLYQCSDEATSLLSLRKDNRGIRFVNNCNPELLVTGDPQKLTQVIINLLSNAHDASPDNSVITINTIAWEHSITLEITDHGSGIPEHIRDRLFEPFFTTKEAGKGTGLGLALVYSIIEEHFGTITIQSPVDENSHSGTRFSISLPRHMVDLNQTTLKPVSAHRGMEAVQSSSRSENASGSHTGC